MSGHLLDDDVEIRITVGRLRQIVRRALMESFDGIGTTEAAGITGESTRTLRRMWSQWSDAQERGERPAIRVARKSACERSDLLFDRSDCYAYASRQRGRDAEPAHVPPPESPEGPDDPEAIADHLFAQTRGNGTSLSA